ncbi:MAG TPA: hypothetical protein VFD70_03630 [Anaerolineae bacterium]|nr:hypothetical protein [Anaerolineae bacterium]
MLSDDETSQLNPSQREMISLANEQAERLGRLVKGIMGVSRIEAGQMTLASEAFDILPLINRTLEQWQACASNRCPPSCLTVSPSPRRCGATAMMDLFTSM